MVKRQNINTVFNRFSTRHIHIRTLSIIIGFGEGARCGALRSLIYILWNCVLSRAVHCPHNNVVVVPLAASALQLEGANCPGSVHPNSSSSLIPAQGRRTMTLGFLGAISLTWDVMPP